MENSNLVKIGNIASLILLFINVGQIVWICKIMIPWNYELFRAMNVTLPFFSQFILDYQNLIFILLTISTIVLITKDFFIKNKEKCFTINLISILFLSLLEAMMIACMFLPMKSLMSAAAQ